MLIKLFNNTRKNLHSVYKADKRMNRYNHVRKYKNTRNIHIKSGNLS